MSRTAQKYYWDAYSLWKNGYCDDHKIIKTRSVDPRFVLLFHYLLMHAFVTGSTKNYLDSFSPLFRANLTRRVSRELSRVTTNTESKYVPSQISFFACVSPPRDKIESDELIHLLSQHFNFNSIRYLHQGKCDDMSVEGGNNSLKIYPHDTRFLLVEEYVY